MRAALLCLLVHAALACAPAAKTSPTTPSAPAPPVPAASVPDESADARYQAIVAAADRDAADRALDEGRKPAALLSFLAVQPGMRVAEIGAGGGYSAELLARAVGEAGTVYAQNSDFILKRFAEQPLTARLQKPVNARIVRVDRDFDSPLPEDVRDLDIVVNILFYHDTVWMKTDRARMNRAIFAALKPGGLYVLADHSSAPGKGLTEVETLHRIEESSLRQEIEEAGFRLLASADFLRNPDDTRDWSASPRFAGERRGSSDRFVLKFQKP